MEIFLDLVILALIIYIGSHVYEINMRLKILDKRVRILERFVAYPEKIEEEYAVVYNDIFGDSYASEYDKMVGFSRKHKLFLPLQTTTEEQKEREQGKIKS